MNIQHEYTSLVSQSSSEAHHYIKQKVQQATGLSDALSSENKRSTK